MPQENALPGPGQRFRSKPRFYKIDVTIGTPTNPILAGSSNANSVVIQDIPAILKRITWAYKTPNGWAPAPANLLPYPYWEIDFQTDNHVYTLDPINIGAAFGSPLGFQWLDLPSPVELRPKTTFKAKITSLIPRPNNPVTLQIILHCAEPDTENPQPIAP